MRFVQKAAVALSCVALCGAALAQQGQTVKIAWLDPLSGLMAALGTNQLKVFQYMAEQFNQKNPAGVKFEVIGIDNKLSAQETTAALRSAMDQGARYVVQGDGSGPAMAIIDALEKHNARNPGKEVLFLNYAAVGPELTNEKCSYWHFRMDADTSMKMEAMTNFIKEQADVKNVYLVNQNYSHGQQTSQMAKDLLARKRPDVKIVGDDLHPLAQVRDFAPYVAKIKQSGADTVITGNWGTDLGLKIKAANEAGLKVKFFTVYASNSGIPTMMGAAADGRVYQVSASHYNAEGPINPMMADFKKKYNDDIYTYSVYSVYDMLSKAFVQARSTEPAKIAPILEGMSFAAYNGNVTMRKSDHQMQQGLWVTRWEKASSKYPYSPENTGYTLAPVKYYEASAVSTPTTCQMKRP